MPATIETIFAKQFSPTLLILSQQKGSKFESKVRRETVSRAEEAYFDTVDADDDPVQDNTRHGDTPLDEGEYGRRQAKPVKWHKGRMLDSYDLARMYADPTGPTVQSFAYSFGRKKDKIIRDAALGTAYIGKEGASSVTFQAESVSINGDGTTTTLGTLATAAGSDVVADISLAKMLIMGEIFNNADVDPDIMRYWAVSPKCVGDMLDLTEVGSADYNTVKALREGKVDYFAGFNFFWTNLLTKDAATETAYRTIAWAQDGIILATIGDLTTSIDKRTDKCNEKQIYSKMDLAAVRMEGAKVHECLNKVAR
jgi:hypothetical protein